MKSFLIQRFAFFLLFSLFWTPSIAQKVSKRKFREEMEQEEKKYRAQQVTGDLLSTGDDGNFYFVFPNVNKVPYYYNATRLKKIKSLREEGLEIDLIEELEKYILDFGIDNFHRDNEMVWLLAQLYEKNGMPLKARAAYRLVLKHHDHKTQEKVLQFHKIRSEFDTLTEMEKDYYVPLKYYYELVEYRRQIDTLTPPKSVLLNMGPELNLRQTADYGPSINLQGNLIVFSRREEDTRYIGSKPRYSENLFFSTGADGYWDVAQPFPSPIQSRCNEGSACISQDGKTLIFSRCVAPDTRLDCPDCMGSCDLYISTKDDEGNWSKPRNLGPQVNSNRWDSHPTLSGNEDTLYFASDRPGGFGLSDIYYTAKLKDGTWSKAQNMGPIINTRGNEYSPYYHQRYDVLYFSSNGHMMNFDSQKSMRDQHTLDLYKSYRRGVGAWKEPKNLGPLVNGSDNEMYFTIDPLAKNLFYAKTEEGSTNPLHTDLYSFPLPMEAQPNATVKLSGQVVNEETGDPYKGIVSVIDLENGIEVAPKETREDGSYGFDLIPDNEYLLVIQGDEFFRVEQVFQMTGDTTILSKAVPVTKRLTFSSLEFEQGKADILPEMEKDLWNIINFLVDNPNFILSIGGHTDSRGNANDNINLSQRRADAIKHYLEKEGFIDPSRITAKGYGSSKPIRSPEITEEDRQVNRRVEFNIERKKSAFDENTSWEDED